MKAVSVSKDEAESVRQNLLKKCALDRTRKLVKNGCFIEIPVMDSFSEEGFDLIEQKIPGFYVPRKTLGDFLDIALPEKEMLPSGWHILGDIIIVTVRKELDKRKKDIGKALLDLYPGCRTVLLDRGIIGQTRLPIREIIAGSGTETIHIENKCKFKIDAMKLMYSKGNLAERKRMSRSGKGEIVVDMFAGIGYFSIPMAVHSKPMKIIAIEINPESINYLRENIRLNKVENIIEPVAGDCSVVTPVGMADRVIMGYLDGYEYLEHGIRALKPGGILHYHEAVPEAVEKRPIERIFETAGQHGREAEIIGSRRIKKYAPGVWHLVVDARIR